MGVAVTDHSYEYRLNDALLYNKGLAVFTVTLGGLMFETCLSGQEYEYKPYSKNKNGSSRSFRNDSKKSLASVASKEEEEKETDVFANAQREVSAHLENFQSFAKSFSKKWKKENTADDGGDKTRIDAAVDYKMGGGEANSTSSFSVSKDDKEAVTTETEFVHLAPVAPGEDVKVY